MSKSNFDQTEIFTLDGHQNTYQSISFTVASGQSSVIQAGVQPVYVLLYADQDCHIRTVPPNSTDIEATLLDTFLPARVQTHFYLQAGSTLSAIRDTADGKLHISPVS